MSKVRVIVVSEQPESVRELMNQIVNNPEVESKTIDGRKVFSRDDLFEAIESEMGLKCGDVEEEVVEAIAELHNSLEEDEVVEFVS